MKSFRLALFTSCITLPALAQEVPAIVEGGGRDLKQGQFITSAKARAEAQAAADVQIKAQGSDPALAMTVQNQAPTGQGTVPRTMPPQIDPVAPNKPLPAKASANLAVARKWINKFQKPQLDEDGVVHFQEGRGQVYVVAAVNHATDIMLAPGERVLGAPIFGDKEGWRSQPATSGVGRKAQSHIIIKPADAGLSTNLVIQTNKRSISIELVSRRSEYMPKVAMDIPDDDNALWANAATNVIGGPSATADPCDQFPTIGPDQYKSSGDEVRWKPVQVYAVSTPVGMKTCVEFPSSIGSQELPAILALANDGGWFSSPTKKIINVRFSKRRYIADELLERFVLVDGVGGAQQSVTYTRKGL